jgi:hypothetical protein
LDPGFQLPVVRVLSVKKDYLFLAGTVIEIAKLSELATIETIPSSAFCCFVGFVKLF